MLVLVDSFRSLPATQDSPLGYRFLRSPDSNRQLLTQLLIFYIRSEKSQCHLSSCMICKSNGIGTLFVQIYEFHSRIPCRDPNELCRIVRFRGTVGGEKKRFLRILNGRSQPLERAVLSLSNDSFASFRLRRQPTGLTFGSLPATSIVADGLARTLQPSACFG